jgi:hypothetical protein
MAVTNINDPWESDTIVPALSTPAGCVPVRQLQPGEDSDSPDVVPAPPRTAREGVDTGKCVRPGCAGLKQKGFHECAPHRLQSDRIRAARPTKAEKQEQKVAAVEKGYELIG